MTITWGAPTCANKTHTAPSSPQSPTSSVPTSSTSSPPSLSLLRPFFSLYIQIIQNHDRIGLKLDSFFDLPMAGGGGEDGGGGGGGGRSTQLQDLPDAILSNVVGLVSDVRSRNAMSLVCQKWRSLERSTRTSLSLRGFPRDLFLLPTCFSSVTDLDLSLLSPWGHPFLQTAAPPSHGGGGGEQLITAQRLRQAFPNLTSLTVYARTPSTLAALAPQWPSLRRVSLVRWHQRPHQTLGSDLTPLLAACPSLSALDLSSFYCWPEDVPPALQSHPAPAASLTRLNLLNAAASEGFRAAELLAVAAACPNLHHLLAACVFNPRYMGFIGDDALLALAAACPRLSLLHLADPSTLSPTRPDAGPTPDDARITRQGLEGLFAALPHLDHLALDLRHVVSNAGPALEALGNKCPRVRYLKLGYFHGVCIAPGLHLDGVALCGGLESICINNCPDLTDAGLWSIARGCSRLSKLEIHECKSISESGIKRLASKLRSTLVDVSISGCRNLDAALSLSALEPIRDRIKRLHIDCIWVRPAIEQLPDVMENAVDDPVLDELETCSSRNKKRRYSDPAEASHNGFWCRLRYLSLWVPAGELLSPLANAGLENCPTLEELCIKVEGDCRTCPRPTQPTFGLSILARYPRVAKMKLDCGDAIGYAQTAPTGQMDLSLWERFFLHGIGELSLYQLDYWPPQDREMNQRSLSLTSTSLIQGCPTLRKLFIHGTTHEHFLRFFLEMPMLRDAQLREDYYPAPDNDMSTEMRVGSTTRFEDALNSRLIPD